MARDKIKKYKVVERGGAASDQADPSLAAGISTPTYVAPSHKNKILDNPRCLE